jgi:hypothetical protein
MRHLDGCSLLAQALDAEVQSAQDEHALLQVSAAARSSSAEQQRLTRLAPCTLTEYHEYDFWNKTWRRRTRCQRSLGHCLGMWLTFRS